MIFCLCSKLDASAIPLFTLLKCAPNDYVHVSATSFHPLVLFYLVCTFHHPLPPLLAYSDPYGAQVGIIVRRLPVSLGLEATYLVSTSQFVILIVGPWSSGLNYS